MWVQSLGQEDPPGGGNHNPLQYSCRENPMSRGAWRAQSMGLQTLQQCTFCLPSWSGEKDAEAKALKGSRVVDQ